MTIQRSEIEAWLGDDHGLTDDQVRHLMERADEIADRYPDGDDRDDREAALTTAYRLMTEAPETVVADVGRDLTAARLAEHRAMVALQQAAATLIEPGNRSARGVRSEGGFARMAGVDRMTVRRDWLGKRDR